MNYQANAALAKEKSVEAYYVIIVIGGSIGNVPTPLLIMLMQLSHGFVQHVNRTRSYAGSSVSWTPAPLHCT
jgi:hypothetical protein